jgi:hypothetical protein
MKCSLIKAAAIAAIPIAVLFLRIGTAQAQNSVAPPPLTIQVGPGSDGRIRVAPPTPGAHLLGTPVCQPPQTANPVAPRLCVQKYSDGSIMVYEAK